MKLFEIKNISFVKIKKTLISGLIVFLFIMIALVLSSCGLTPTPPPTGEAPKLSKLSVFRSVQDDYASIDTPICLTLDENNRCEKMDIILEFNNPDKRTIASITINSVVYKNSSFSTDSTSDRVLIDDYQIEQTEGEFLLNVEKIYYQMPNEIKMIQGLAGNTLNFLISPTFKLTLDVSSGREHVGFDPIIVKDNLYKARINIFADAFMQETIDKSGDLGEEGYTFGKYGYTFGGWFDQPNGLGANYESTDYFTSNKDLTLYAYYDLTCSYQLVEAGEDIYALVTGLTDLGLTNSSIVILDQFETKPVREIASSAFKSLQGTRTIIIPDSLIKIGARAFEQASDITIDLKNVEIINEYAFSMCTKISLGSLTSSLTSIGNYAFQGCTWKTRIKNPDAVGEVYFDVSDSLIIPNTITTLGDGVFKNSKFKSVYFWENSSITSVGIEMFANNKSLQKVWTSAKFNGTYGSLAPVADNGIKTIGNSWFFECTSLIIDRGQTQESNSYFAEGLETIGELAFASGGIGAGAGLLQVKSLMFPDSLKVIKKQAFSNTRLIEALFKDTKNSQFVELGELAFQTTMLKTMTFYSLSTYGPSPFSGSPIEYIKFDLSSDDPMVSYIPHKALYGNGFPRFAKLYVPSAKLAEYNAVDSGWWKGPGGLIPDDKQPILAIESIHQLSGGSTYISYDVIEGNNIRLTNLFRVGEEPITNLIINPAYEDMQVKEIGSYVACDDTFTTVKLPNTITNINDNAFRAAKNLYEVIWYSSSDQTKTKLTDISNIALEKIGEYAFTNTSIISFKSNNNLNEIGKYAFYLCKYLNSIELINGVEGQLVVHSGAFAYAGTEISAPYSMIKVWINASILKNNPEESINKNIFSQSNISDVYIKVPNVSTPPPTGYVYPISYYAFGNPTEAISLYFSNNLQYNLFLAGENTNQYFNLGECGWNSNGPAPENLPGTIEYVKGTKP